jgi:Fe-S cluster biogenesis protein NfuA
MEIGVLQRFRERLFENSMVQATEKHPGKDPEFVARVEKALDTLRPYLKADGGSVRLADITKDYVVEVELLGACGTCPMSAMTLRAGIEQVLRRSVPQVTRVEAVNSSTQN